MTLAEILAKKAGGGKPSPAPTGGLKITQDSERAAAAAVIKQTLDCLAPKTVPQLPQAEPRELGAMEPGERLPMDYPPQDAPAKELAWFNSLHSVEGSLGIVMEPESGYGWLSIQHNAHQPPLLVLRLPLLNHSQNNNPF